MHIFATHSLLVLVDVESSMCVQSLGAGTKYYNANS